MQITECFAACRATKTKANDKGAQHTCHRNLFFVPIFEALLCVFPESVRTSAKGCAQRSSSALCVVHRHVGARVECRGVAKRRVPLHILRFHNSLEIYTVNDVNKPNKGNADFLPSMKQMWSPRFPVHWRMWRHGAPSRPERNLWTSFIALSVMIVAHLQLTLGDPVRCSADPSGSSGESRRKGAPMCWPACVGRNCWPGSTSLLLRTWVARIRVESWPRLWCHSKEVAPQSHSTKNIMIKIANDESFRL
jgi:hypothetical protein